LPFSQKNCYVRYQFFSFVVYVVEGSVKKSRKKCGLSFKKIGDDVIAQKAVTSFKQVARHRMAFFKIKSTCPSDFLKNITLHVLIPRFSLTHSSNLSLFSDCCKHLNKSVWPVHLNSFFFLIHCC
jgi:hypothetical protein